MTINEMIGSIVESGNYVGGKEQLRLDLVTLVIKAKESTRVQLMNTFDDMKFTTMRKDKIINTIEQEVL